jgi:hypothetical protein
VAFHMAQVGILERHGEAGERHHLGAMCLMEVKKLGLAQGTSRARGITDSLSLDGCNGSRGSDSGAGSLASCRAHRGGELPPQKWGADRGAGCVEGGGSGGHQVGALSECANASHCEYN